MSDPSISDENDEQLIGLEEESYLVPRPGQVILSLPVLTRWEFTRRHPYYLMHWERALPLDENADELSRHLQWGSQLILQIVNFTGQPIPPQTTAQDLDEDQLVACWRNGAIGRLSVRGLVTLIVSRLIPQETKRRIAEWIYFSAQIAEGDLLREYNLIKSIVECDDPVLNQFLPESVVTINNHAPQRAVVEAITDLHRETKEELGLSEQRRRDDKYEQYLEVWDLREGWSNGNYHLDREMKLREVAEKLSINRQTAASRYKSAFEILVGHEYSASLWSKVIGIPKLSGLMGQGYPRLSRYRPTRLRRPSLIDETTLSSSFTSESQSRFLDNGIYTSEEQEELEAMMDIHDLIKKGWSNEQIAEEMEMTSDQALDLIQYLREAPLE